MTSEIYLRTFRKVALQLDKEKLKQMQLEAAVVEVLGCAVLKLYKKAWASPGEDPLSASSRIFFSIWADDLMIEENKLLYNIHAFKLRQLDGYKIESNKFATVFRAGFKRYEKQWPNVSVQFGPLTLMQGGLNIVPGNFQDEVLKLAYQFLQIAPLIDNALLKFKG
jgi:hypothetical protein